MDSSVDLPHPEGPETDRYSPRVMSSETSSSARVSSSASPSKTRLTRSSRMSGRFGSSGSGSAVRVPRQRHQDMVCRHPLSSRESAHVIRPDARPFVPVAVDSAN